jgi:hypothetical protein
MSNYQKKTISDQAVQEKTGKGWAEWFKIINQAGGQELSHKEIVAFLKSRYGLSLWWQQMITVTYEQQIGRREKHQKSDGFQISKSRTFNQPLEILQDAWVSVDLRRQWLEHASVTIGRTNQSKSLRMNWGDGKTTVEVQFYPKGKLKTQLIVQHSKIDSLEEAEKLKHYWHQQLNNLEVMFDKKRSEV